MPAVLRDAGSNPSTADSALLTRIAILEQCVIDSVGEPKNNKDKQVCRHFAVLVQFLRWVLRCTVSCMTDLPQVCRALYVLVTTWCFQPHNAVTTL